MKIYFQSNENLFPDDVRFNTTKEPNQSQRNSLTKYSKREANTLSKK